MNILKKTPTSCDYIKIKMTANLDLIFRNALLKGTQSKEGGYDYKFVGEPSSDLKCLICLCVAKEPQQHGDGGCGKIFCQECITQHKKRNNKCPNCQRNMTTFKDEKSKREIQSLMIKCENEGDGCEWVGELRSLKDHLKTCGYVKLPCPNRCRPRTLRFRHKSFQVYRKDLQKHLSEECPRRQHTCPHCEMTGEHQDITEEHIPICPKMVIECCNAPQCTATFPREDTHKHISACLYEKVSCKYKTLGCTVKPLRKKLKTHENDDKIHLRASMDTVVLLKNEICLLRLQLRNQNPVISHAFKITSFAQKKSNNIGYYSTPFFTHPQGYKMIINIDANGFGELKGTHVSVWVFLIRGEYDDELEFPFKGTITFELLNQLEDSNHHRGSYTHDGTQDCSKRVVDPKRAGSVHGVPAFIPHTNLDLVAAKNCQYLKDDCLVFRIYAQVPSYKPWLQCTA